MAQELLTTFEIDDGLHKVSLYPIQEPAGTFIVRVNGEKIWDRKEESTKGFPEAKVLKQLVRDRICTTKPLGHSDRSSVFTDEEIKLEEEKIRSVLDVYLEGVYEEDIAKVMKATQQDDLIVLRREEMATTTISKCTSVDEWKEYLAWNRIVCSDIMDRSLPNITIEGTRKAHALVRSFIPAYQHLEPDRFELVKVERNDGSMSWKIYSHETARLYEQKSDGTNVRSLQSKLYREIIKD